jgi:hypothetical protein
MPYAPKWEQQEREWERVIISTSIKPIEILMKNVKKRH